MRGTAVGAVTNVGVTYFAGRSASGDDAHLAAALTNEVASQLRAASLAASTPQRGAPRPRGLVVKLSEGGSFADVDLSLTGSVFREGSMLRTTVKVTRSADGTVVWSGTKIRPISDLPILARLIAQEVAVRIGAKLSNPGPRAVPPGSLEVYDLLLRGSFLRFRYAPSELLKAIDYFEQAIAKDSTSAEARRLRDQAQLRLLTWGGSGGAIEVGLFSRGILSRITDRDYDNSERLVQEADAAYRSEDNSNACRLLTLAIESDVRSTPAYALRTLVLTRKGELRAAFGDAETVTQLGRPLWGNALRAVATYRSGDTITARRQIVALQRETSARRGAVPYWDARFVAIALAESGRHADAASLLRRIDAKDPRVPQLRGDPWLRNVVAPMSRPRSR
ncbi:MAG: hypothetical protein ABIP93_17835 [Gemmatimonadaceae bacterium]